MIQQRVRVWQYASISLADKADKPKSCDTVLPPSQGLAGIGGVICNSDPYYIVHYIVQYVLYMNPYRDMYDMYNITILVLYNT